ncbi:hypothetical protein HDE_04218 [Halotydeus destructor]|nr:hypothetical protein HDE_04218 [Halotydeus destructor]
MVTFEDISEKLLSEGMYLTALELHAELLESKGKELPSLRDFFADCSNFEPKKDVLLTLPRTSSVTTFDSLDLARGSDDGALNETERIAVLEYELRKANEEIRMLRTNLTLNATIDTSGESGNRQVNLNRFSSHSSSTVTSIGENLLSQCLEIDLPIKPHERRATNFLVNDYLLKSNCKLTAITFSDENTDCDDLDNWDSVGLNLPQPPDLLRLYRFYHWALYSGRRNFEHPSDHVDCAVQVDSVAERTKMADSECQTNGDQLVRRSNTLCESSTCSKSYPTAKVSQSHSDLSSLNNQDVINTRNRNQLQTSSVDVKHNIFGLFMKK